MEDATLTPASGTAAGRRRPGDRREWHGREYEGAPAGGAEIKSEMVPGCGHVEFERGGHVTGMGLLGRGEDPMVGSRRVC